MNLSLLLLRFPSLQHRSTSSATTTSHQNHLPCRLRASSGIRVKRTCDILPDNTRSVQECKKLKAMIDASYSTVKSIKRILKLTETLVREGDFSMRYQLWDVKLVKQISSRPAVQRVIALGTLFALELQPGGVGCPSIPVFSALSYFKIWGIHALKVGVSRCRYGSLCARYLLKMLHDDGIYMWLLGNIIHLMSTPCTSPQTLPWSPWETFTSISDKFHRAQSLQDDIVVA